MRTLLQDLRYGIRTAVRQPAYSLLIILTLALAIGANTVTFSFTNILLVRPLPLRDQGSLVWIFMVNSKQNEARGLTSVPDLLDFRGSLTSIHNLAGTTSGTATLTGHGDARALRTSQVTANLLDMWGVKMAAGRRFLPGEDAPGAPRVVILSHRFWQREFNGDPSIVGRALTLNRQPHSVVGIASSEIEFGNLARIDVWTPVVLDQSLPRDSRMLRISARLADGVSFEQADAELRAVAERLQRDHPDTNAAWGARLAPTKEAIAGGDTWVVLGLLTLVVGAVLLIACANIANIVLAKATSRRRELAVRCALGASRGRMIRQLLTESVLHGTLGGLLGLAVAEAGLVAIKAAAYEPIFELVSIDRNVLMFTAALSLMTPIVFSLLPAIQASRTDVNETLKDSTSRTGGARGRRSRAVLVVSQLALAVMLLIVSTLLIRTMFAVTRASTGIVPTGILTMRLEAPEWRYRTDASVKDYYSRLLVRLRAMPGVNAAAAVDRLPLLGGEPTVTLTVDGYAPRTPDDRPWAVRVVATEEFFGAAGIPIFAGRSFRTEDAAGALPLAVVNQEMARRYWKDASHAIGARVKLDGVVSDAGNANAWIEIIGVCGDVKRADLTGTSPQIYLSAAHHPTRTLAMMIRADEPEALQAAVRAEVRAVDPDVAIHELRTMTKAIDDELASSRIITGMFAAFALLALVLAASGLYGVIAYSVSQRVQEIGIRIALGALTTDITRLIVRQTVLLVVVGCGLGLAGGALLARASSSVLYEISPLDPSTYLGVVLILSAVAMFAVVGPIRRATRVDPLVALRAE